MSAARGGLRSHECQAVHRRRTRPAPAYRRRPAPRPHERAGRCRRTGGGPGRSSTGTRARRARREVTGDTHRARPAPQDRPVDRAGRRRKGAGRSARLPGDPGGRPSARPALPSPAGRFRSSTGGPASRCRGRRRRCSARPARTPRDSRAC
ncbi:hypothetical protein B1H20_03555 [Streptomyces violaceoruber]|uniref:Uncharacterized protein n=1 Tax=Streptomyces violaceoruber TaxID=1935 RepID=A0A1V0U610_STRVN|nr:hypothetical protein B1H20_03555 [Streptomyces violaceoruber]